MQMDPGCSLKRVWSTCLRVRGGHWGNWVKWSIVPSLSDRALLQRTGNLVWRLKEGNWGMALLVLRASFGKGHHRRAGFLGMGGARDIKLKLLAQGAEWSDSRTEVWVSAYGHTLQRSWKRPGQGGKEDQESRFKAKWRWSFECECSARELQGTVPLKAD